MNTTSSERPDPEALLAEVAQANKGALKIFLGASPGVGKTYKMLEAAREARRNGSDIVIGIIESHGRQETEALCEGIEAIPLMQLEYRGARFRELDLDAILRRAPAVVLVDELAHRNIPGTRHPRRYQDIAELLAHGIDVWTTVNVQHLESLNDTVARITGVRMRETVPDSLLAEARDVVLVDLTPRELVDRLKQGKVYVPEQARAAIDGFFSPSNLAALRELAFHAVADRIDVDVRDAMRRQGVTGPWPVRARVVVAVDGIGNSEELVRHGHRLAERSRAHWTVVFVDRGTGDAEQGLVIERIFQLARRLGGETLTLRGQDPVRELLRYARESNATTIVAGRSRRRWLAGQFGRSLSQRLLREGEDFEVSFVLTAAKARRHRQRWSQGPLSDYLFALGVVAASVTFSVMIEPLLPLANLSLVFLAGVLLVAVRTAMWPVLFTALASALAYNFFFTEPRYTFYITRTDDLLTVVFFLIMGLIGGQLAGRLRRQVLALRATNEQTRSMLALSQRIASAADIASVGAEAVKTLGEYVHLPVVLLMPRNGSGRLSLSTGTSDEPALDDKALAAAQWSHDHRQSSGAQTETLSGIPWRFLPLAMEDECFGVLGFQFPAQGAPGTEQLAALEAMVSQTVMAMARARLSTSLGQARVAEETERLRSALLSSVSHDLRTPLASMIGATSSLRTLDADLTAEDRNELLDSVLSEAQRLDRYIQNLLDMTRLGHGTLKLERDWIGIDDIVDSALRRTRELLRNCHVVREIAADLPLLYVHPALIEQALVNVIENAARFSPPGGEIRVSACREKDDMLITISDAGPGIPPEQRKKVFDMFFTGGEGDRSKHGTGLGLAICHGMVAAHFGQITALPGRNGQGTSIVIRLPLFAAPLPPGDKAG